MNTRILLRHVQFHGAKRLVGRHSFYWAIGLLLLLWCAVSNLSMTVKRFLDSPTSLVTEDTVSMRLPFPAVLVCPEVYYPSHRIENFLEHARYPKGMTADSIRPIIKQLTAFFSPDAPFAVDELSRVQEFLEYNDLDVEAAGEMLTTSCKETFYRCRFLWHDVECTDIFHMELTQYGYCCVFNGRSMKRELRELVYEETPASRDWYTSEVGPFAALMVAVNQSQQLDDVDLTYKWLVLQSSQQYVEVSKNGTPLSPGAEMWSSFHTRLLQVADDSRFLGDSLRGCWIENKQLKYFPVYNTKYCLLECRMAITIRRCQCLLPIHLRSEGVPVCNATSLPCARRALEQFDRSSCDCPLTCKYQSTIINTITYQFSSTAMPYDSFYDGLNLSRVTVARVFIKSHETLSYMRRPFFNFFDLFSQLGGVFNVFFGCSILSILELFQLAWCSFQQPSRTRASKRQGPRAIKSKKIINSFFSGICHRTKKGRVGKRVLKRKVAFLNTQPPRNSNVLKIKMFNDFQGLK